MTVTSYLAEIPSPTVGAFHLGPLTLRMYAVCIIVGIVIAVWLGNRRVVERGGRSGEVVDIAIWAVPFGIVGGRLYHVITTPEPYFGENGHLVDALKIWNGGLGIWGAIALGFLGAYIGARRIGYRIGALADALAPGIVLAQAVGRLGNYFNNELYGGQTTLPWGLKVWVWDTTEGRAVTDEAGNPVARPGLYHPTFLYELIWNVLVAFVVLKVDKRRQLGHGRAFALYVALYCLGRLGVELLRTDEAEIILGQRLNVWTSLLVGLVALSYFVFRKAAREPSIYRDGFTPPGDPNATDRTAENSTDTSTSTSTNTSTVVATGTTVPSDTADPPPDTDPDDDGPGTRRTTDVTDPPRPDAEPAATGPRSDTTDRAAAPGTPGAADSTDRRNSTGTGTSTAG